MESCFYESIFYIINRAFESKLIWYFTGIYLIIIQNISYLWIWILSWSGHSFAALTREISSWSFEDKIHIHARACILYFFSIVFKITVRCTLQFAICASTSLGSPSLHAGLGSQNLYLSILPWKRQRIFIRFRQINGANANLAANLIFFCLCANQTN